MRSNRVPNRNFSFGIMMPEISVMAALLLSEKRRWFSVLKCSYTIQIEEKSGNSIG